MSATMHLFIAGNHRTKGLAMVTTTYGHDGRASGRSAPGTHGFVGGAEPATRESDGIPGARLCVVGADRSTRTRMWRRMKTGKAVRPYRGIYVDAEYWKTLNPKQRMLHVAEALSRRHPEWVFAGLTAAAAMNLDYTWSLLNDDRIYVASGAEGRGYTRSEVTTIFVASGESCVTRYVVDGAEVTVRTTTPARTLVDCALRYPFRLVLGMFDAAFRRKLVDAERVVDECDRVRTDVPNHKSRTRSVYGSGHLETGKGLR